MKPYYDEEEEKQYDDEVDTDNDQKVLLPPIKHKRKEETVERYNNQAARWRDKRSSQVNLEIIPVDKDSLQP